MIFNLPHKSIFICLILINFSNGFLDGWWQKASTHSKEAQNTSIPYVTTNITQEDIVQAVRYESFFINYTVSGDLMECVNVSFKSTPKTITTIPPPQWFCPDNTSSFYVVQFNTTKEGIVTIEVEAQPNDIINTEEASVSLYVKKKNELDAASDVIGWIYTVAWDISFVPQIIHNWKRHSVVGLSFDFITLNFMGFSCYFLYNMGLYWIDAIQAEYELRNPTSFLHVRLNDVIFPLYACLCTAIQIIQCIFYERGNQRVSTTCRIITILLLISIVIYAILVGTVEHIWWLDFLYWLSYIKLAITSIKYIPQLFINYRSKSTEGWSILQVILDFTGGSFSLIQMFLLAYNYDDFQSILTDPSKLGLGVLAIFFNIFFFIQHYCLYRNNHIENLENKDSIDKENQSISVKDLILSAKDNVFK